MADKSVPVPSTETTAPAAVPKSRKKLFIIILLILLVAGGGGGFYVYRVRASSHTKVDKSKKNLKDKKSSDEEDEAEEDSHSKEENSDNKEEKPDKKGSKKLTEMSLPEDGEVKHVVELQPFIINLADKDDARYLRMTISLGIGEGGGEGKADPLFTTRVRNALLSVLTTKTSDEVLTIEGKATLRKQLLLAAQEAVAEPSVHAIYITDFIVQL